MIIFPKRIGEHKKKYRGGRCRRREGRGAAMQGGRQEAAKALRSCGPTLNFTAYVFGKK